MTRKGFIGSSFAFAGLAAACAATTWAGEVDLGGTWSLVRSDDPAVVYPAKVPGDVHSALFAAGVIPVPVLIASCISQDGHASLPLLAESKGAFLRAKAINCIVALIVGFAAWWLFA